MDCRQAREAFEGLVESGELSPQALDLEEHLSGCPECQEWFARELLSVNALEILDRIPAPLDFTQRVLAQLPDATSQKQPVEGFQAGSHLPRIGEFWQSLLDSFARPPSRRRLAPALAIAASLLLVVGLVYVILGGDVTGTPGAATGASSWVVGIGAGVVVVVVVAALLLWRRKE